MTISRGHTAPSPDAAAGHAAVGPSSWRAAWWPRIRRWAVPALGVLVFGLLVSHAHKVDWSGAWQSLQRTPLPVLAAVLGLSVASHALYGSFDLLGRRHTRHGLPVWRTWAIAVASYAFNLNLGSLVGGVALRARLYARAGLDEATVAQVVGMSMATNWLGYGVLAGALFAAGVIEPPQQARIGEHGFRLLGAAMLGLAAAYLVACRACQGRSWRLRGRPLRLPSARTAMLQMALSAANWALMGLAMSLLLGDKVGYGTALGVLMAAAVVGVVTPIPAGLGVLEAVYLGLLSGTLGQGRVMGAVLAYRALYYLLPLGWGLVLYALLERHASVHPAAETSDAGGTPPA
ncbi:lysylphosphatidylglycerol synthase domain-containing protein [Aquabacterium sp. J223]|uniref:lysylphosphatidylglycerol synthase domain-containing protein n=1 Tax=Aquabacterium sp. J223 TaxID=2898431 RepID=UPI0021AE0956|nr:lysylphosphatidylglycerol synthase domain-containing protein [Aquabacterium sp. J223]UUX94731.1 lysylphosphatidylglycerol synthase domain-containing protein [Aquabacterium sp. J223]